MAGLRADLPGHLVLVAAVGYAHEPMALCAGIARHADMLPMPGLLQVEPVGDPTSRQTSGAIRRRVRWSTTEPDVIGPQAPFFVRNPPTTPGIHPTP